MKEMKILEVKWKKVENYNTFAEFKKGAAEFDITPIVKCEIPKGYEVFGGKHEVYAIGFITGTAKQGVMCGYHLSENWVAFEFFNLKLSKEITGIKMFYV